MCRKSSLTLDRYCTSNQITCTLLLYIILVNNTISIQCFSGYSTLLFEYMNNRDILNYNLCKEDMSTLEENERLYSLGKENIC
jgi:hypothetical protein